MENELKARITADISGFVAGMAKVENATDGVVKDIILLEQELKSVEKQYKTGKISIDAYASRINRLNTNLTAQRKALSSARSGFQETEQRIRGANNVALEFNRIIQDAPFGIIGVGNNIQQLSGNFSQLASNAGGTVPALKAAFSQLITGPNIALLAISALTTAFTVFQMGLFKSKSEAEELVDEIDRLKEASDKYVKSLDAVSSASLKGSQSAVKEITELERLYSATQDTTLGIEQRRKAVKELLDTYPNAFKGISEETILNGKAKTSYINLTNAILARAKATAAQDVLVENERKLLALQSEREKVNKEILANETQIDNLRAESANTGRGQLQSAEEQLASSLEKTNEGPLLRRAEINKQINELTKDNLNLVETVKTEQEKTGDVLDKNTGKLKTQQEILSETVSKIFNESDFITQGELIGDAISKGIITKADGDKIKELMAASFAASDSQALQDAITKALAVDFEKSYETVLGRLDEQLFGPKIKEVEVNIDFKPEQVDQETQKVIDSMSKITNEIETLESSFQNLIERNSLGILTQTAGAFGNEIAASFETGNAVLDSFVRNLFRAVPQIIAAYTKLSAARNAQANAALGANAKESAGEGITLATKAANALGPVGLAVLPVLIAGALGLIASAFTKAKSGGGASGGGGSAQTFGNTKKREFGGPVAKGEAYIVGEKRREVFVPNTNGVIIPQLPKVGGTSTGGGGTMKIEVEVKGRIDGESIRLSNKRANTRVRNT